MKNLRRWELDTKQSTLLILAADSRLSETDYFDDQSWQVRLSDGEQAAIALQTQYGGRAGLVSLVPMWEHDGRLLYEGAAYHQIPVVTAFAPNYIQLDGALLPEVTITLQLWAMDSQSVGCAMTLNNSADNAIDLRFDLYGHVIRENKEQPLGLIDLAEGQALYMGDLPQLAPIVMVEGGHARDDRPKVGRDVHVDGEGSTTVRWVHVGGKDRRDSLKRVLAWLTQDWTPYFQQIDDAALMIPQVQTSNAAWDYLIAASYNRLIQAFFNGAGHFPKHTFSAKRLPEYGYSAKGDGSDYPRGWDGQNPTTAYLAASAMATVVPDIAQGVILNYLASQTSDGAIDNRPAVSGEQQGLLCLPILARMAWHIFQQSEDDAFLETVFPALMNFLERWLAKDLDSDHDQHPEWQDERQTGYVAFPTFATWQPWSQGADIRTVEGPDLLAYLLAEAKTLQHMAKHLDKTSVLPMLNEIISVLQKKLDALWQNGHFVYRDRDTHITTSGTRILENGAGDIAHDIDHSLLIPNRIVVRIEGGVKHVPRIRLHIEGLDDQDRPIEESHNSEDFQWYHRHGVLTSDKTYTKIDRIWCDGLSRVYRISATTLDTTGIDVNTLLPLWVGDLPENQRRALVKLVSNTDTFMRPNGLTMVPADSRYYDPSNADGAGGIWPFWLTLVGEGLIAADAAKQAGDMLKALLDAQAIVTDADNAFSQFYHAEQPIGLGEGDHLAGIVPLHLLHKLTGIRIISQSKVWVGGLFGWDRAITVRQYGVSVRRTRKKITIKFPSGMTQELPGDARWQSIIDPDSTPTESVQKWETPKINKPLGPDITTQAEEAKNDGEAKEQAAERVVIHVDIED